MPRPAIKKSSTEAPTSKSTVSAEDQAKATGATTQEEVDFASLMNQYYLIKGRLMPIKVAVEDYSFEEQEFADLFNSPNVKAMLKERQVVVRSKLVESLNPEGVPVLSEEDSKDWKLKGLSPQQLIVANAMLDLVDTKSEKKRLQDLNVSTRTWDTWMSDPVFNAYMRDRAEAMLANSQHLAHVALLDKVRGGDLKAIEYMNELNDRYIKKPPPAAQSSVTVNNNNFDTKTIVGKVIEIITDEVEDTQTAMRIGDRLRLLMGAQIINGEFVEAEEPIVIPEIREPRKLSSSIEKRLGNDVEDEGTDDD